MQIVLQRVDETDKETFQLIKMLKFLSVRKSISCGTGHYLLPKRGGSGCLERFAFPSAYIIKKTNNLQISHKAGECRRKKSAKEQVSTFNFFFQSKDYVMYQVIAHLFCSRFRQVSFLGGNKLPELVSINFLVFPSIPLSRFTCKWWNMVSFHFHDEALFNHWHPN